MGNSRPGGPVRTQDFAATSYLGSISRFAIRAVTEHNKMLQDESIDRLTPEQSTIRVSGP